MGVAGTGDVMASPHHLPASPERPPVWVKALTHTSSMREKVFEHKLLGDLGIELMARGIEFEVLHGETDRDGHDVVLEAGGILRHVQLKVTVPGGARSEVTVNTRLAAKPAGCVVWLSFDPASRSFTSIRWFGNPPGTPLPDPGSRVARHSRANAQGIKNQREGHRVLPASRFDQLDDVAHLADRLFGTLPTEPLAFLQSRLRHDGSGPAWLAAVADGNFTALPADIGWKDGAELGGIIDGYRLLELISTEKPAAFLDGQRAKQQSTGSWPGDAAELWTTLFLEARADHFGANDLSDPPPRLDLLCRQLRTALADLKLAHA